VPLSRPPSLKSEAETTLRPYAVERRSLSGQLRQRFWGGKGLLADLAPYVLRIAMTDTRIVGLDDCR
jgi:hypothetical protein